MVAAESSASPAPGPPDADAVAAAFGLGPATAPLEPNSHSTWPTWRLRAAHGDAFVKQLDCDDWQPELAQAMAFEAQAAAAGIAMPVPYEPVQAEFGYVCSVDGRMLRAHQWVDGRPVTVADDLAGWLGATLATLHCLEARTMAEPTWYGLQPAQRWEQWQRAGAACGQEWAGTLATRMPDVADLSARIAETFAEAGDYVLAHQDLRQQNMLVTGVGPMLVDWDSVGPDSASLEAADAIMLLALHGRAEPSTDVIHRACRAYLAGGGRGFPTGPVRLARRAGHRLLHIGENVERALAGSTECARYVQARLDDLPNYRADLVRWARLLP